MKLWGKVASGIALVMAAAMVVIAVVVPEAQWESLAAAAILFVIALFGVPALVRLFSSFTGDEEVLVNGMPGSATITALKPTRWRYNRYYPIVRFALSVEARGMAYTVEIKQAVDPELLQRLVPGTMLKVRVDRENHKKVVIDWRGEIPDSNDAAVAASGAQTATETPSRFSRTARKTTLATVGAIFVFLSLVFAALAFEEWHYASQGVIVQGTATGVTSQGKWAYRFTTREGRGLEGASEVLHGTSSKLQAGGFVEVQYLRDAPETNRIPGQRAQYSVWRNMTLVAFITGLVLLLIGRRRRKVSANP
ncbi:MAG: DUF3592 domain-containing protein [Sulfuricaulis sp.]|uniref:DUF3592 domain-containing protein n=1 Tax=Sulfuricaulis sp. TaxID=2003553 RepID=UPI0034A338AB